LVAITSDAIPKAGNNTIYTSDDLETKISAQIKQAIHLDNVTLHQQYKYQTGKRGTETSKKINNSAADNNTGKETTPMIAVTKKPR
jgi:hypothetical protein